MEGVIKMINLADFRLQNRHYEFDLVTKKIRPKESCSNHTIGYVSWQKTSLLKPRNLPVGCFLQDDRLSIFIGQNLHTFTNINELELNIRHRKLFSWRKRFEIFYKGKSIERIDYLSASSSSEEWPDDYSDIFKYISKLTLNDKKELGFELWNRNENLSM